MYKTVRIADYELGLLYRDRLFQAVLGPGVHRLLRGVALPEVRTLDLRQVPIKDPALSALYLTRPDMVAAYFVVADHGRLPARPDLRRRQAGRPGRAR